VRSGRSSRVRPLRSLGLLFLRKGMLRTGTMRILLRLSHDSFMPEKLCTNRAPTCSSSISPFASPLCGVATSSPGWHAPGHGARPLSLHFGTKNVDSDRSLELVVPEGACTCDRRKRLCGAAEVRIYGNVPGFEQPFWDVELIFVLLAPFAQASRGDVLFGHQV
jgi:hypothetical protein